MASSAALVGSLAIAFTARAIWLMLLQRPVKSALSCCTSAGMVGIIGWSSIRWRAYRLRVRLAVAAFARIAASSLSVTRMMIFLVLFSLMMVVVLLSHGCLLALVSSFRRGTGFGVAGATCIIGR